eukprot:SAG31_NODE_1040_length_10203_cov_3.045428_10_plen_137_part_00
MARGAEVNAVPPSSLALELADGPCRPGVAIWLSLIWNQLMPSKLVNWPCGSTTSDGYKVTRTVFALGLCTVSRSRHCCISRMIFVTADALQSLLASAGYTVIAWQSRERIGIQSMGTQTSVRRDRDDSEESNVADC